MGKIYEIPKCPKCKKSLKSVQEIIHEIYTFNKKTGKYKEENSFLSGEQKVECRNCSADVSEIFEEGACNYQAKRR